MNYRLFFASNNPGKQAEVAAILGEHDLTFETPKSLALEMEVDETGKTLEENSRIKASAWQKRLGAEFIVMADDTGFEIDALGGEPGVHVRRWRDGKTRMGDDEIITYCLERMRAVPKVERGCQLRAIVTLAFPDGTFQVVDGVMRGSVLQEAIPQRHEGMPLASVFHIDSLGIPLGELRLLPRTQRNGFLTHREKAFVAAAKKLGEIG